jgi:Trypsin
LLDYVKRVINLPTLLASFSGALREGKQPAQATIANHIADRQLVSFFSHSQGFMWFMIKVTFGEHDRCDDSMRPETRFVLRAISQKFSYSNFDNDMALLRLNDRVPITDYIRPICLPTNKGNYAIFSLFLLIIVIADHRVSRFCLIVPEREG